MVALTSLGWLLVVPIALGLLAGYWLDRWLRSGPLWTLLFLSLGIIIGALSAFTTLRSALPGKRDS